MSFFSFYFFFCVPSFVHGLNFAFVPYIIKNKYFFHRTDRESCFIDGARKVGVSDNEISSSIFIFDLK